MATKTISIGQLNLTWQSSLPILIAALQDGNPKGRKEAVKYLQQMATVADMLHDPLKVMVHIEDGVIQAAYANTHLVRLIIAELDDNGDEPTVIHDYCDLQPFGKPFHEVFKRPYNKEQKDARQKLIDMNL